MPNWTDIRQITPQPVHASETRRALGLQDQFVIGYSGNLGRAHEFDTLLGAARLLREARNFSFLITGAGAKLQSLRTAVAAEHLDNFHFLPYQPAELLADSLAASDVHLISLLPALEGLIVPSKLYGILAAGRPAVFIGDPEGEVARVIRDHDCGITVGIGESAQLADALRSLSASALRVTAMSLNARRLAVSRYTTDRAVGQWRQLLERVSPEASRMHHADGTRCVKSS